VGAVGDPVHSLFWRGALQNLHNPQAPFLPGGPPEQILDDHSKGFVVGYTAVLSPNVVNAFHWGFTRQSTGFQGNSNQEWNVFYGLDQGIVYSHNAQTPVHNLLDDFSWTKGKHTLQIGGNLGFARNPRLSYDHSFNVGKGATNWMSPTGFANTATHDPNNPLNCGAIGTGAGGSPLDPCHGTDPNTGLPFPEPASTPQFDYPIMGLLGMVSDIVGNYNYDKSGTVSQSGVPVQRKYGVNWYEFYGQDSWRVKQNPTITYGVRWSLFPPPWEVNGFQASPTCDSDPTVNPGGCPSWSYNLGTEFAHNAQAMKQGIGYDATPLVSFILGGPGNPGPGFYHFGKSDFSPRVSFAYSPRPGGGWLKKMFGDSDKTVIRGGFSKVYDRAGMQLLSTFDANAPGGLSATVQNPCCAATDPAGSGTPYDAADGQDTTDRVRAVRRSKPEAAWRGKTRDLHILGFHPLLWAAQQRQSFHRLADYGEEANGREAQSHQGRASTPEASSYGRGRCMASQGCAGLLPIPCRSGELDSVAHLQSSRLLVVAERPCPSQPTRTGAMGSSFPCLEPVDSSSPRSAPLSRCTLLRHSSFVRAVCVNALVRICAGGDQRWSSLPRQRSGFQGGISPVKS
jgi:hypothetical protein